MQLGANVNNQTNPGKNTALHAAIIKNLPDCVDLLLRFKADRNIKNRENLSAVHLAKTSSPEIQELISPSINYQPKLF